MRITSLFPNRLFLAILVVGGLLPPLFIGLFGMVNGLYRGPRSPDWTLIALDTLISIGFTVIIGTAVVRYVEWLRAVMPWREGGAKRFLVEVLGSNLLAATVMAILATLVALAKMPELPHSLHGSFSQAILNNVLIALLMNSLLLGLFEGMIFFRDLQETKVRAERLEREKLQSQLEILKNQLKPHFLFNSLNVLSSLVHADAQKSEEFIAEFARVYRYVLDTYQQSLVSLERELAFMESYLFLQKIRFGDALQFTQTDRAPDRPAAYLPPMSLQLLLENAFKHNQLSTEHPLHIELILERDHLQLRNAYQPRTITTPSSGIGQENLRQRYRLMQAPAPTFEQQPDAYFATLPLIFEDATLT